MESLNSNMICNGDFIQNNEELSCCNNIIVPKRFPVDHVNNNLNDNKDFYLNNKNQKLGTPLCSKYNKDYSNIKYKNNNNYINKDILNNNLNSDITKKFNDSTDEQIMPIKKYDNMVKHIKNRKRNKSHRNRTNLFNIIKDVFNFLFIDNDEEEEKNSDNNSNNDDIKLDLKHRPILKRIIENDIISQFQRPNRNNMGNREGNNNNLRYSNTHVFQRPYLFADDLMLIDNYEDNNEENYIEILSLIPVNIIKEKNESNDDNDNKCTICLSDFDIGEKKSILPCMHSFHFNCIEKWIKRKRYCPICKYKISLDSLKKDINQNYK